MTTEHSDIIAAYIAHGWSLVPIAPGTKGPMNAGWNTREAAIKKRSDVPEGYGVGLGHAFSGTMALDIDDWMLTRKTLDIDALAAASDAVAIISGKPGRGKLLYRMPFGLVLPSKQFKMKHEGDDRIAFELRCGTMDEGRTVQDLLPPSIHPEMGHPYQWGGAGHWSRLPMIPQSVLDVWQAALVDTRPVKVDGVNSSWDEIRDALGHISPDIGRAEWRDIGMALHWAGEQTFNSDQAFHIWNTWSQGSERKYPGEREMVKQWGSFRTNKKITITIATLFHLARQNGWVRPVPDASTLFADISAMVKPDDVIATMRPQPPDLDLNLLPKPLVQRAQEVSTTVGCDPLVPIWAGLGAVCGVVDAQARLELMPGFKVPPVLWLMTIGDPGDRKSPGSRPMLSPLKSIEAADKPRFKQEALAYEVKEAAYASAKKALLDFAAKPEYLLGGQAPQVPPKPDKPVPVRFTVSDITSAELVRLAGPRPRGLLCYLDEMNSWVNKLTNKNSGEDRSAWVVGYEAERYQRDRVGEGETPAENFALSIYGNMQPQVLEGAFQNLAADGLLQRFLPAVLRHDQTRIGQPIPEYLTSAESWANTLRLIYALPPLTYRLTPEAYAVFRAFQEWYEDRMKSERLMRSSNEFITAFGKITGLAGRLALIFHIIENPFSHSVTADLMQRVVRIVRDYVVPTYRYVFDIDSSMSAFDNWIMEYIIQHADKPSVTMSEIKMAARRPFEKANITRSFDKNEWVLSAMTLMERMKWVARIDDGSREYQGHVEWLINPHLQTTFKEYRAAVVRAKAQRNEDRIQKAGSHHIPYTHGQDILEDE